jgi:hypothetical protein
MKDINRRHSRLKTSQRPRKKTMKRFARRHDAEDRELKIKAQADQREAEIRLSTRTPGSEALTKVVNVVDAETAPAPSRPSFDELWGLA